MTTIKVRQKGQITLPNKLRQKYKLEAGTLLEVHERPEGMLLQPVGALEPGKVIGTEQYQKIITELEETRRKWH